MKQINKENKVNKVSIFSLVFTYKKLVTLLVLFTVLTNLVSLIAPRLIASGIDSYTKGHFLTTSLLLEFIAVGIFVFIFLYLQNILQTYTSEKVAHDLRKQLAKKISEQNYAFVQRVTAGTLLTNLTSDVDGVKTFVSQAIGTMVASICLIIGASIFLISINWQLALAVLTIVPIIGITFFFVLGKLKVLFGKTQGVIDWLNKVINESILGAALIRILDSQKQESDKFRQANKDALEIGLKILAYFSALIPVITFVASLATLIILALGGHFVIAGSMTLGQIAAFNSYVGILIFPIIMIGFISGLISRSAASYERIAKVLSEEVKEIEGTVELNLDGEIKVRDIYKKIGDKSILKDISFQIKPKTKTAIIGPTAAGKTQLLYILNGLITADSGEVLYDGTLLPDLDRKKFHKQIGFVFQDSIIFNTSIRENISFSENITKENFDRAIKASELADFIKNLPQKTETIVSERGGSLSGGQKQRIMLARALALNPKILFLDDFTARVDTNTEKKILGNIENYYPDLTLISVTQKIASVEHYDQIIMLMEGELVAIGKHKALLKTSPEYIQLYESQKSLSHYELQS